MKRFRTCCFIQHYSQNNLFESENENPCLLEFRAKLKETLISLIENFSVTNFISGMALGLEQCSAEVVIELKAKLPNITLEGVLPYESQDIDWTEFQRDKYYSIMQKIDKEVLLQHHYSSDCMRRRDLYMINKSKYIILCTSNTSEIDNIVSYAKSSGRIVFIIDLNTLNIIPNVRICR